MQCYIKYNIQHFDEQHNQYQETYALLFNTGIYMVLGYQLFTNNSKWRPIKLSEPTD